MSPQANLSCWSDRLRHARYWRSEVKKSFGDPLNGLQVISNVDGEFIMALGSAPGDSNSQTLMAAKIPSFSSETPSSTLELQPFTMLDTQENKSSEPSAEVALFYERLRGQVVNGISGFHYHNSGAILLSSFNKLQIYKENSLTPIAEWNSSAILNASFSPVDPQYVAFCSNSQLYVDKSNQKVFESDSTVPGITNGMASFIAQEELERFDGYWWNPSRLELLYERVDESNVTKLAFECPGKSPTTEPIRYPVAGTPNAKSDLRMLVFDGTTNSPVDKHLGVDLNKYAPWQEYLVRAGWTDDGNRVYALFMDRFQTKMIILLISREAFIAENDIVRDNVKDLVYPIYQESSPIWINSNNLTRLLTPSVDSNELYLFYGSEKLNHCHIFLRSCEPATNTDSDDSPLTSGEWSVIKDGPLIVDTSRKQVYFLANYVSPIVVSLCVTSYEKPTEPLALTPRDLCYKFERGQSSLSINPDIGFVCWLSSIKSLPTCQFYRLLHNPSSGKLPSAVFQYRISVKDATATPNSTLQPSITLTELFRHRFFTYKSQNSGEIHYALLLWPRDDDTGNKKYPLILHVYAGPGVQMLKSNWQLVAQFLKFISIGYAVLIIDGRGSANRGINFESPIKEKLGTVEVEDQVEGLLHVTRESGIIDIDRVGVVGWSYGGFMSILLLISHPDKFKLGIVGGAVIDWNLYDTCYTERYMGSIEKNAQAYKDSCIIGKIGRLPDEEGRLLIVHGLQDENVHFAHTEKLINALISAGKPFQQLIFPSERHGVRNAEAVEFFHASMISFFDKALR